MTPPEHADALAEHQAKASRFAKSAEGMLFHKFVIAIEREHTLDKQDHPRNASLKAASDTRNSAEAALIAAIEALQAKAVRE